ncbi:hypothetical protein JVX98_07925 [Ensifer sp. PDNC004]|uniref:phage tail protein n=1 Tax=Ensifer sp. PDNC004 TaxID=2811423 RepID=UPI0019624C8C|nr:phage tail protein [Ensifer sp. PDNC004]QRY68205.1 hypothetical protein JVX98_07925 [Ensifer sp. PDNC004]
MRLSVLLLAGWFLLATTSHAYADPVSAIVGIISAVAKIGTIGQLVLGVAFKVGTSLLARARGKREDQRPAGVKGSMTVGGDNPMSFIIGTYATAGQLEYVNSYGKAGKTPNAYLVQVVSLSDLPISGMSSAVWINGEKCTIDWNAAPTDAGYPVLQYRQNGTDHLWVRFRDGTQTAVDPYLSSTFGADATRPWLADMIGRGVAYAIVTARVNREVMTSPPRCKFVLQGIKFYDLRKDTTAGGSGPHRWGDYSTYEWSDNTKVAQYNLLRGLSYNGEWFYGGQSLAAFQLPASNWMAAMNECDRQVAVAAGGTEKQFRCGAEIALNYQPIEAIKELDKSCNGRTAELGGIYKTICGMPGLPVYSFTDDDIVITSEQQQDPYPAHPQTYNGAHASYPEPAEDWAMKDAPPRYNAAYEAADDDQRLIADLSYPMVPYGTQVQRLMYAAIEEERRFISHTGTLPPEAWLLEPLDAIAWTSARNGYDGKLFLLGDMDDLPGVNQVVAFRELDPADYSWSSDRELPVSVGPTGPIVPPPQVMTGWAVEPYENARRPSIKVSCAPDQDDVKNVLVEVRLKTSQEVVYQSDAISYAPPYAWVLPGTFLPNTQYEVRGRFVPYSNRPTEWSDWKTVTTPNALITAVDILDNSIIAQKIADAAVTAEKIMNEAVTSLKIAERAVSSAKIAVGAITEELVANGAISAGKIAEQAIGLTKFAAGITPVEIISGALPTTGNFEGRQAFFNGKLYRFTGGNWTSATAAGDVVGQITGTQIADDAVTSPKIAANAITASELAAFSVVAGKVAAAAIGATEIQAAAITADKMAVGKGKNLLRNTEFYGAWQGWLTWNQNGIANRAFTFNLAGDPWALATQPRTMVLGQNDANADPSVLQVATGRTLSVIAGKRYEAFIFVAAHRCPAYIGISWFDAAGNFISESVSSAYSGSFGGTALSGYYQLGLMATAPANAVVAELYIRKQPTVAGNANSYVFVVRPYFGEAGPNQVTYSDWEPGGFTFIGPDYLATGAVIADKVAAGAITTEKLNAASVTADKIAFGAITGDKIMAAAITGEKIAAGSVGANHIAANSITAKQLVLTDFSNIIVNDFTTGLTDGWTLYGQNKGIFNSAAEAGADYGGWRVYGDERNVAISAVYPCQAGDVFFASVWCWNWVSTYPAYLSIEFLDEASGSSQFATVSSVPANTGWVKLSGRVTAPSGKSKMRMFLITDRPWGVYGNPVHWSKPVLRRAASAELIVDGSITANKLSVNSLSAISASFGDAYFSGVARSVNGKLLIDFNTGGIEGFT